MQGRRYYPILLWYMVKVCTFPYHQHTLTTHSLTLLLTSPPLLLSILFKSIGLPVCHTSILAYKWKQKYEIRIISFFFLATLQHMEFPGQRSDPSHSCDLSCSCGSARSLTHAARPGIEPVSHCATVGVLEWSLFIGKRPCKCAGLTVNVCEWRNSLRKINHNNNNS